MTRPSSRAGWTSALCGPALFACSTAPPIVEENPIAVLDLAEQLLAQAEPERAEELLSAVDEEDFTGRDLERYKLLRARSLFANGDGWDAYEVIRSFAEDHRFSDYAPAVEDLHFEIGRHLTESDRGFWIFGSDRTDGQTVLREFAERYPSHPAVPHALKILGEIAFEDGRYYLARERFRQIVEQHPGSEWAALARFRIAISGYRVLVGPEYDLEEMTLARNELADYLETEPERPEFRREAEAALVTVDGWIAARHRLVADFYRTVGNRRGEVYHLRLLVADHSASEAAEMATARLEELAAEGELGGAPDGGSEAPAAARRPAPERPERR